MILPKKRDPRFITIRRGGTLQDANHYLLAIWAADCAQHVLHLFEEMQPNDERPRRAIEAARAWAQGTITMSQSKAAAGQTGVVAHVAAHELGAAAYAIKAARETAPENHIEEYGRIECEWQRAQLPIEIRDLVLDDQKMRNEICWFVFNC